jgi:hypothetical protein
MSADEQNPVHETVKIQGKLASSGTVTFNPRNIHRPEAKAASAQIVAGAMWADERLTCEFPLSTTQTWSRSVHEVTGVNNHD